MSHHHDHDGHGNGTGHGQETGLGHSNKHSNKDQYDIHEKVLIPHAHLGLSVTRNADGELSGTGPLLLSVLLPLPAGHILSQENSRIEEDGDSLKVVLKIEELSSVGVNVGSYFHEFTSGVDINTQITVTCEVPEAMARDYKVINNILNAGNAMPDIQVSDDPAERIISQIKPHICISKSSHSHGHDDNYVVFVMVVFPPGYGFVELVDPIHDLNRGTTHIIIYFDNMEDTLGEMVSRVVNVERNNMPLKNLVTNVVLIDPQVSGSSEVEYTNAEPPSDPPTSGN